MDKKLYWRIDNGDASCIMELDACLQWINGDAEGLAVDDHDLEYILTPAWMTEEEFDRLPDHLG